MIRFVLYPITLRPSWHLLRSVALALFTRRVVTFEYPVAVQETEAADASQTRTLQ